VGNSEEDVVGFTDGTWLGEFVVGVPEGPKVGKSEAIFVGSSVSNSVGSAVGSGDAASEGSKVGPIVTV